MKYNTQKEKLKIREYGRNIQSLIEKAVDIEDKEKRNKAAKAIVKLMSQMNTTYNPSEELQQKLWAHLFIISDFKLDVDSPYPPPPQEKEKPSVRSMGYGQGKVKHKHYGRNVELMIEKAINMEDEMKRKSYAHVIANYMKMVFNNWNREHVSDDVIKEDLKGLSGGKLTLDEDTDLQMMSRRKRKTSGGTSRRGGSRGKGKRGKN